MKRVLVISNNCFSKTNSNGRTLGNLFFLYEKEKISQFFISGDPDYSFCGNYFQVTDEDVFHSLIPFKRKKESNNQTVINYKQRTVKNMILRNFAWNLGAWKTRRFSEWLKNVNPEVVVLQVGDCAFMIRIALSIVKKFNAKLIVYNTEAYYFKDFNYFRDGSSALYRLFIGHYKKIFEKMMRVSKKNIYLNDDLKKIYNSRFNDDGLVIYNSSFLEPFTYENHDKLIFAYFGNLGLGRDDSLCEIAECLLKINPSYELHIYGNCNNETISKFDKHPNIIFHSFIPYDEVIEKIKSCDVLVHVESFDDFYVKDSRFAFSGKIADYLYSGRSMIVYAPNSIAIFNYLNSYEIYGLASNCGDLMAKLRYMINYKNRIELSKKQLNLANSNHNLKLNSTKFVDSINL